MHDGGEIAEGIVSQPVVIRRDCLARNGLSGDDKHLRESEGDTLAKLVRAGNGGIPPLGLRAHVGTVGCEADGGQWVCGNGGERGGWRGELLVQISVDAQGLHLLDGRSSRAKAGLVKKPRGNDGGGGEEGNRNVQRARIHRARRRIVYRDVEVRCPRGYRYGSREFGSGNIGGRLRDSGGLNHRSRNEAAAGYINQVAERTPHLRSGRSTEHGDGIVEALCKAATCAC